jgi:hypothetical protein
MLNSKRFLLTVISGIVFLAGTLFFKVEPIAFASGIGIILAPYLAAESYKPSNK